MKPRRDAEEKMILLTKLHLSEAVALLKEQIDREPSLLHCVLTLGVAYSRGLSPVCGEVTEEGFRLRSRQSPGYSSEAVGRFRLCSESTRIEVTFREPLLARFFQWLIPRKDIDHDIILTFLTETLHATLEADPQLIANPAPPAPAGGSR